MGHYHIFSQCRVISDPVASMATSSDRHLDRAVRQSYARANAEATNYSINKFSAASRLQFLRLTSLLWTSVEFFTNKENSRNPDGSFCCWASLVSEPDSLLHCGGGNPSEKLERIGTVRSMQVGLSKSWWWPHPILPHLPFKGKGGRWLNLFQPVLGTGSSFWASRIRIY